MANDKISRRAFLKGTAVTAAATVTVAGSAGTALAAACDPTPGATQGLWGQDKAMEVTRELFSIMDKHTDAGGNIDAAALTTSAQDLLRGVNDYNMSYLPITIRKVAEERHGQAWSHLSGKVEAALTDDTTEKSKLTHMAQTVADTDNFPSPYYKAVVVSGIESGSWGKAMSGLEAARGYEESNLKGAVKGTLDCRAQHNRSLAP